MARWQHRGGVGGGGGGGVGLGGGGGVITGRSQNTSTSHHPQKRFIKMLPNRKEINSFLSGTMSRTRRSKNVFRVVCRKN